MYNILQLNEMLVPELREIAEKLEVKGYKRLTKKELIYKILDYQAMKGALPAEPKEEAPKEEKKVTRKPRKTRVKKTEVEQAEKVEEKKEVVENNSEGRMTPETCNNDT